MLSKSIGDIFFAIKETLGDFEINVISIIVVPLIVFIFSWTLFIAVTSVQRETRLPPPVGCHRLGLQGCSKLSDHYWKEDNDGDQLSSRPWTVKALFIYPLKSCAPIELEEGKMLRSGLKYDRQFAFGQYIEEGEWRFMSQRSFPQLARVKTEVWIPNSLALDERTVEWADSKGCVIVRFPYSPVPDYTLNGLRQLAPIVVAKLSGKEPVAEFRIPFKPSEERIKSKGYTEEKLRIWRDDPTVLNMGCEIDKDVLDKLRHTLGVKNPISLFRATDANKPREVFKNAPKKEVVGFQTSIAMQDSYPVHILNLASVHDVSTRLPASYNGQLSPLRFRANIYLEGPPAFNEDDWTKVRIGSTPIHVSCRTTRCKLPNVDQNTGIADRNEPLTTMRSYRVIDKGNKSPCLGMNVTPLHDGTLRVGDVVEVLETGEHFFLGGSGPKVMG